MDHTDENDRPTIIVPAPEPGIPEYAPDTLRMIAHDLDRLTGGDGRWTQPKGSDK